MSIPEEDSNSLAPIELNALLPVLPVPLEMIEHDQDYYVKLSVRGAIDTS